MDFVRDVCESCYERKGSIVFYVEKSLTNAHHVEKYSQGVEFVMTFGSGYINATYLGLPCRLHF
jgi:hypothetical protein